MRRTRFGSSPRMRGKLNYVINKANEIRIIPAHAGQTYRFLVPLGPDSDHPRACGANTLCFVRLTGDFGSSPRMRGKQVLPLTLGVERRIIPAHAGQTGCRRAGACRIADHPRACGANTRGTVSGLKRNGSSPRMRGKPRPMRPHGRRHRIIPAHAGQTCSVTRRRRAGSDHPRACGANARHARSRSSRAGSSPRMRGKRSA